MILHELTYWHLNTIIRSIHITSLKSFYFHHELVFQVLLYLNSYMEIFITDTAMKSCTVVFINISIGIVLEKYYFQQIYKNIILITDSIVFQKKLFALKLKINYFHSSISKGHTFEKNNIGLFKKNVGFHYWNFEVINFLNRLNGHCQICLCICYTRNQII